MSDDLDDLLRRAMKTLDDQVPTGYFEELSNRTLARLGDDTMQRTSGTDQDREQAQATGVPPEQPRDIDSGLHDIRNLASSQRLRLSSRRSSQNPIVADDDVLVSSSGGWKAVALPEPAKVVSLPQLVGAERPAAGPSEPAEPASRPIGGTARRSRLIAIVGLGVAAAAGAVLFISTRQDAKDGKDATPAGATSPAAESAATPPGASAVVAPPPVAAPAVDHVATETATSGMAAGSAAVSDGASEIAPGGAPAGGPPDAPARQPKEVATKSTKGAAGNAGKKDPPKPTKPVGELRSAAVETGKVETGKADTRKPDTRPGKVENVPSVPAPIPTKTPGKSAASNEPSLDELLKEAGGETKKDKDKDTKPKLDKTSLSGDDIKRGMTGVAGKAQACYAGTQGMAAVKLVVAPSGKVQKVTVTGMFAGTSVGACVEAAVRGATFPPWDGGPQSFGFSYLLSE